MMIKKFFSMVLMMALCLSLSATALAADAWDGTADTDWHNTTATAFTIDTAEELAGLAKLVNEGTDLFSGDTITLATDLDLKEMSWTPIGNSSCSFQGTFDGGGYTISNLKIDSSEQYVGMFGYIKNSTIQNVVLESPDITATTSLAKASVGALVGYASGTGNVEYCAVRNGAVSAPNSTCASKYSGLGGLVGCHETSGNVSGCYNYMTAVSTQDNTMTRCGGVVGSVGKMAKSLYTYNTSQKGIPVVGGYASGSGIPAQYSAYLKADGADSSTISSGSDSVALSAEQFADGTAAYFLRTGGYSEYDVRNHYAWGQDVEGDTKDPMPVWNGTKVFRMRWVQNVNGAGKVASKYVNELATKEIDGKTYRVISNVDDWVLFANLVNSNDGNKYPNSTWNAIVEPANAPLDFSVLGTLGYNSSYYQNVVSIGASSLSPYLGTFNGNGCTITGLDYQGKGYTTYALFGYTGATAHISSITLKDANIQTASDGSYAAFVGTHRGTIENCHAVSATVSAPKGMAAGVVRESRETGKIEYCSFSGSVQSGYSAGGIVGYAYEGTKINRCWNKGSISGGTTNRDYYAGGILAQEQNNVTISNCYNTGDITGYYVGGIVGSRYGYGTVTNCHSYGAVLIGTSAVPVAMGGGVTDCYYLADSETDKVNGTAFKTAEEFKDGTVLNLLNGGNSETVWYPYINYPILDAGKVPPHVHSWTYAASGNTLTATCENTGCLSTNTELKINAPALKVYGDTASTESTISATSIGGIATLPAVQYEQKNGESWMVLSGAPDVPGSYRASVTVDTDKTASVEYTIDQATLTANGTGIASGTYGSKLSELTVSGLTATLNGNTVSGTWTLTGEDVPNVGDTGSYTATFTPEANAAYYKLLTAQVTLNIAPAQHAAPTAVEGSYAPNAEKTAFVYTISAPAGTGYEYSKDGSTWQDSPIFDGFNANDKATFYARVKADTNHTASEPVQSAEVTFEKLTQTAPALNYQVSGKSGSRTITIAAVEGAEYSFDGGATWGEANEKNGVNNETVEIAIRFKETTLYNASASAAASVNTAKAAQTITFDPSDRVATYGDGTLEARIAAAQGAVTYTSSNTAVAAVDANGVVTVISAGDAIITAMAAETETYASAQASYKLTVNPKSLTANGVSLTLSESTYVDNGSARTPGITLKDGSTALVPDTDYEVKAGSTTSASAIGTYTITLTGKGNYTGEISAEWTIVKAVPPTIDSPAEDTLLEAYEGQTAQMTVVFGNADSYQWYVNRNDGQGYVKLPGATGASYTTSAVKLENDGFTYYCVAGNADGETRSPVFTLRVMAQPALPQTGDDSSLALWMALALLSGCTLLALRKRKAHH